jgi:serine/threonine protein kinase
MVLKELKLDLYDQPQVVGDVVNNNFDLNENNEAIKSFLKEAQVLRNLKHPNIIKFL